MANAAPRSEIYGGIEITPHLFLFRAVIIGVDLTYLPLLSEQCISSHILLIEINLRKAFSVLYQIRSSLFGSVFEC